MAIDKRRMHAVVGLRADDLRQAHDLPLRVGQFERHAGLARHSFDDADRHQGEGARQVLGEADDLAALDADRRLDLVARHHRARMGGQHLGLDIEVGQLALDQARGEFEGLRRRQIGRIVRGFRQQMQRRQRTARSVEEQWRLALLVGTGDGLGRNRHRNFHRLDAHRRQRAFFHLASFGFDHDFALFGDGATVAAILPTVPQAARTDIGAFEQ
jgi:hypothetical protein